MVSNNSSFATTTTGTVYRVDEWEHSKRKLESWTW